MGKKYVVRLTEGQFTDLIASSLFGKLDSQKDSSVTNIKNAEQTSGSFPQLNLNNQNEFDAYARIADNFISSRKSNLLGIRGSMLANAAKKTFNSTGKYVPVELALSQLALEGGFSNNPNARPIRTKNPFNVGNVDSGRNVSHSSVESGIQAYYDLMAKKYLGGGKTASSLLQNFVNTQGNRYATDRNYESKLNSLSNKISNLAQPIYASIKKTSNTYDV